MLRWTAAGAVAGPTTVQIRVSALFDGRVPAGAPSPSRSLSVDEVRTNLYHFTEGLRGPRTRPCTTLVLSGSGLSTLTDVVDEARGWGLKRVVAHLPRGERDQPPHADAVVVTVRNDADKADLSVLSGERTAVVLLDDVDALMDRLQGLQDVCERVVLTWPFPPSAPPPPAAEVAEALQSVSLSVPWGVKGLPPCQVPAGVSTWRSANRWYVDAAHQCADALLFFPDVVRFAKLEPCRFCHASPRCDGVVEAWLQQGRVGRLTPVT